MRAFTSPRTPAAFLKAQPVYALHRHENQGSTVLLIQLLSDNERAPMFGGTIDGKEVRAFMRKSRQKGKRPFLSFFGDDGTQVAKGDVVVNDWGIPLLAMRLEGSVKTQWVSIGKSVSDEVLLMLGADPAKLHIPLGKRESAFA